MKFKSQSKVAQRGRPRWWACNFGAGRATGRGAGPAGRPTVREEHGLPLARVLIPRAPPAFRSTLFSHLSQESRNFGLLRRGKVRGGRVWPLRVDQDDPRKPPSLTQTTTGRGGPTRMLMPNLSYGKES